MANHCAQVLPVLALTASSLMDSASALAAIARPFWTLAERGAPRQDRLYKAHRETPRDVRRTFCRAAGLARPRLYRRPQIRGDVCARGTGPGRFLARRGQAYRLDEALHESEERFVGSGQSL